MAEIVRMPKLSDTMTEGVVAEWHKKVGDAVSEGELLAEIETDKATMEFESFFDGVLLHIGVEKGGAAPINSILAIIGQKGDDISGLLKDAGSAEAAPKKEAKKEEVKPEPVKEEVNSKPAEVAKPVETEVVSVETENGRIFISPLAKKMAEERNINISHVNGSGENGRIVKRDIENFVPGKQANVKTFAAPVGKESFTEETVSQMRKTIAKRLAESKFTAPHFYLKMEVNMDNAIEARKTINTEAGVKVSFNDMVIKAVAAALRKHPKINSSWLGDKIRYNEHIHVGVAVAVPDGLLVPVIRFTDSKGLAQINEEVKEFVQKAKDKKLQPQDWEGNTFTISNLGMYGIEDFTAIINPPDACILAVGGIKETPVVKNGQIVPGNVMKLTLSCDHRVVDGASGSEFLNTVKSYLENPIKLII